MANIIIVEDELWLAELYGTLLSRNGHQVRLTQDAYDAMEEIDREPPELIILDLLLPWTNGLQLLHEIASHYDLYRIPIILCTGVVSPIVTLDNLSAYGVVAILDKLRMQPAQLLSMAEEVIRAKLSH